MVSDMESYCAGRAMADHQSEFRLSITFKTRIIPFTFVQPTVPRINRTVIIVTRSIIVPDPYVTWCQK